MWKLKDLKSDPRMIILLLLGFSSGLPLLLSASTLGIWLLEQGISKTTIGALSLVSLPYTFKFLWAPFVDNINIPFFSKLLGRRRSFIVLTQILLSLSMIGLGLSNPSISPWSTAIFALLIAFFSASQDIVIDAYRVEILDEKSYGTGAAITVFGYRIGMLVAGAGALYLASSMSWPEVYFIMSSLISIGIFATLIGHEPQARKNIYNENSNRGIKAAILAPLQEFSSQKKWFLILLLIVFYKIGDAFLTSMTNIFFLEIGFSKIEIANVAKVFGLLATLGGGFIAAAMTKRMGIMPAMLSCGVIHALANLIFVVQALVGYNLPMLVFTIGLENITGGMTGVMLVAYISSLCTSANTATQYALLSSLMALGRSVLSSSAGYFATIMGWPLYFIFTSIIAIPALLIIAALMHTARFAIKQSHVT